LLGQFASEVFVHFSDAEDASSVRISSAGGGGVVEQSQEEVFGADLLVPERGGVAQAALEDLLRLHRCTGCAQPPERSPPVR
jgi:hypothetical protein